jgi:hypothetical protein
MILSDNLIFTSKLLLFFKRLNSKPNNLTGSSISILFIVSKKSISVVRHIISVSLKYFSDLFSDNAKIFQRFSFTDLKYYSCILIKP